MMRAKIFRAVIFTICCYLIIFVVWSRAAEIYYKQYGVNGYYFISSSAKLRAFEIFARTLFYPVIIVDCEYIGGTCPASEPMDGFN